MDLHAFLGHIAGRVAQGMRPNDPVTIHYAALMRSFAEHALSKWSAVSVSGLRCSIHAVRGGVRHACSAPAAGPCIGCGAMCCVGHGMVSPINGSILCAACVQKVPNVQAPPPPPPQDEGGAGAAVDDERTELLGHLSTLGLEEGASLEQIKARFRELSKTHHPDVLRNKIHDPAALRRAEQRYQGMTEAFHWLIEHAEQKAA